MEENRPTICKVCGRPASQLHCGVATCKGCKTFFRRMCISDVQVKCDFENKCFDLESRAHAYIRCRSCRFRKCLSSGMNPLALELTEQDTQSSHFKQLVKRKSTETQTPTRALQLVENALQHLIDSLEYLELKLEVFRLSAFNPDWTGLTELLLTPSQLGNGDRYGPMPGWPLRIEGDSLARGGKFWFFFNLLTTVEYAKTFEFFHKLDFVDRHLLLRHTAMACMNFHNAYYSVSKKVDSLVQPDGRFSKAYAFWHYPIMMMSIPPLLRYKVEKVEYVLLKAIFLCNPAITGLSPHAQTILCDEREKYGKALFEHCRNHHTPSRFVDLLEIINLLERQQELQRDAYHLHLGTRSSGCALIMEVLEA